ncbi:MAG: hypothetical protein NAG76_22990 [Candidatus Pristimantibacillus lignocellulolyticus]|uniref:RNA helicase n=1 Tax=Candidatus Pristimantibacillus lignocellulolyticus TaxID=2994561 RepID=A0A9J6ZF39_9BACL|nr:MAG: hypothetical protein NAG76_22990 [Candidatus Pristimantibacillus lignocellulolyticus]
MAKELIKINLGLVMPIAEIDNCKPEHWAEVKSIIISALNDVDGYEFETKIVSESNSVGLIHKRIVQGLYNSDIVICDVSCKNPNVMFELGMRLAFDKPTIIVKDDKTNYSFDTGVIEHIDYPRDLRFSKIVDFKNTLLTKVIGTYLDSVKDADHSPFLKSFGDFKSVTIESTEVSASSLILEMLDDIQTDIIDLKSQINSKNSSTVTKIRYNDQIEIRNLFNQYVHENSSEVINFEDALQYIIDKSNNNLSEADIKELTLKLI